MERLDTHTQEKTRLFIGLKTSEHGTHIARKEVEKVISDHVDAGTFYMARGLWKGEFEESLVFECMDIENHLDGSVGDLPALKTMLEQEFDQDSVMIEQETVEVAF